MVAWARFAASTRTPLTTSKLVMASESQSNNSRSRCRPSAFNPASLLWAIQPSTAPLCDAASCFASRSDGEKILRHRQNLFHCRFLTPPLQEKNAPPSTFPPPDRPRAPLVPLARAALQAIARSSSSASCSDGARAQREWGGFGRGRVRRAPSHEEGRGGCPATPPASASAGRPTTRPASGPTTDGTKNAPSRHFSLA